MTVNRLPICLYSIQIMTWIPECGAIVAFTLGGWGFSAWALTGAELIIRREKKKTRAGSIESCLSGWQFSRKCFWSLPLHLSDVFSPRAVSLWAARVPLRLDSGIPSCGFVQPWMTSVVLKWWNNYQLKLSYVIIDMFCHFSFEVNQKVLRLAQLCRIYSYEQENLILSTLKQAFEAPRLLLLPDASIFFSSFSQGSVLTEEISNAFFVLL